MLHKDWECLSDVKRSAFSLLDKDADAAISRGDCSNPTDLSAHEAALRESVSAVHFSLDEDDCTGPTGHGEIY